MVGFTYLQAKLAITSAKSKKRSRHGSIASENMAKLEASFAISQYPNTTAKEHLASSLGLKTVTVWQAMIINPN